MPDHKRLPLPKKLLLRAKSHIFTGQSKPAPARVSLQVDTALVAAASPSGALAFSSPFKPTAEEAPRRAACAQVHVDARIVLDHPGAALRAKQRAAAVERLNRRRAVRALAAVVARGRAARLLARRADAFRAARGLSEWRQAAEAARRRAAADDLLDAYADARRTQRGLERWRRGAARLRRRRRLRTHGRRAFHRWAKLIRYARRLRAARVFGVLKRAAQRRRRRELVVADAYRRARLRLVLGAWVPVAATWKAHRITYELERRHMTRLVAAVFARWVRVRRFRRAARDFLRARGLERRRTRQLARRCLRGWRARGRQALVLATPQQKHNRERSSRSLFSEDAIRRIHAPYT